MNVVYIKDILNENEFCSYQEIQDRYPGAMNWLEYVSLVKAIPEHWKFFITKENLIDTNVPKWKLLESKKIAKQVYRMLTSNESEIYKY